MDQEQTSDDSVVPQPRAHYLRCPKTGRVLAIDVAPADGSVQVLVQMLSLLPAIGTLRVDGIDGGCAPEGPQP